MAGVVGAVIRAAAGIVGGSNGAAGASYLEGGAEPEVDLSTLRLEFGVLEEGACEERACRLVMLRRICRICTMSWIPSGAFGFFSLM